MPPYDAVSIPMLETDDGSIRIRHIIASLFDARDESRFRCFKPDADERHCDSNRDTLDRLTISRSCVDRIDNRAVSFSDGRSRTFGNRRVHASRHLGGKRFRTEPIERR